MSGRYGIRAIGTHLPSRIITWPALTGGREGEGSILDGSAWAPSAADPDALVCQTEAIARHAQTSRAARHRRRAADDEPSSEMELFAARQALAQADVQACKLDAIMVFSTPADQYLPGNAACVARGLECSGIPALGIDAACASFSSALHLMTSYLAAHDLDWGLVAVSAQFSRLVADDDPLRFTVGDGAAAVLVGRVPQGFGELGHAMAVIPDYGQAVRCGPRDAQAPW